MHSYWFKWFYNYKNHYNVYFLIALILLIVVIFLQALECMTLRVSSVNILTLGSADAIEGRRDLTHESNWDR